MRHTEIDRSNLILKRNIGLQLDGDTNWAKIYEVPVERKNQNNQEMHGISLFANGSVHSGPAWRSVKTFSPYYKDIAHQKEDTEDKFFKFGGLCIFSSKAFLFS